MTDVPLPPEFLPTAREPESPRGAAPRPVLTFDPTRRTNARAIADAHALGFLRGSVLDLTVGHHAGFWTEYRPTDLTTNDLDPAVPADLHEDCTNTGFAVGAYGDVCLDIDYGYRGSSKGTTKRARSTSLQDMDRRFGTSEYRSAKDVDRKLWDATYEACRIAQFGALVKCQEACVSSTFHHQTAIVLDAAKTSGFKPVGFLHVLGGIPQPTGKKQVNVWTNYSTMVLMRRRRRLR